MPWLPVHCRAWLTLFVGCTRADNSAVLVPAGGDCSHPNAVVADLLPPFGTATIVLTSSAVSHYTMCFEWPGGLQRAYPDIDVSVLEVHTIRATEGADDYAVVGSPKEFAVVGHGIGVGDTVAWVAAGELAAAACASMDPLASIAPVTSTVGHEEGFATFSFTKASEELWLCYQFGSELPLLRGDIAALHTRQVASITALRGADELAVVGRAKTYAVSGVGVAAGDVVRWSVDATGDCSVDARATGSLDAEIVVAEVVNGTIPSSTNFTFTSTFDQHSAGQPYMLCYAYLNNGTAAGFEPWFQLGVDIVAVNVVAVTAVDTDGSGSGEGIESGGTATIVALVGAPLHLTLTGAGLSSADLVRWTTSATSCDLSFAAPGVVADLAVTSTTESRFPGDAVTMFTTFQRHSNGEPWRLCYRWGAPSEEYIIFPNVQLLVKELVGLSVNGVAVPAGHSAVAVVGSPLQAGLLGAGIAAGDRAKFVAETAGDCSGVGRGGGASEEDLVFVAEGGGTSDTTLTLTFAESSGGEAWAMCYQTSGTSAFVLLRNITIVVHELQEATVASGAAGSPHTAVDRVTKVLEFVGDGVSGSDVAVFVAADEACGDAIANVTALAAAGFALPQPVSTARTAAFTFTFGEEHGRLPPNQPLELCYMFGMSSLVRYPGITLTVKSLQSLQSTRGVGSDVAVVTLQEQFTLAGVGMASGDAAFWVAGETCDVPKAQQHGVSGSGDGVVSRVDDQFTATFTFSAAAVGSLRYCLCYAFGTEPVTLYKGITMEVKELRGVGAVSQGSTSVVVADVPKTLVLDGDGVGDGDTLTWVPIGSTCAQASVGPTATITNASATVEFSSAAVSVAAVWVACYQFADEATLQVPSMTLSIRQLVDVTSATVGISPAGTVANMPKALLFAGVGLKSSDGVLWISAATASCPSSDAVTPVPLSSFGTLLQATFTFTTPTGDPRDDSTAQRLCYYHGIEPARLHSSVLMHVMAVLHVAHNVSSRVVTPALRGGSLLSIVNHADKFVFDGPGVGTGTFAPTDTAMWVSSAAASDADCVLGLAVDVGGGTKDVAVSTVGGAASIPVQFSAGHTSLQLCYQFGGLPFKLYPSVHLDVAQVTGAVGSTGSAAVFVSGVTKTISWAGTALRPGDRVMWVGGDASADSDCVVSNAFDISAQLKLPRGGGSSSPTMVVVDSNLQSAIRFAAPLTAEYATRYPAKLCYSFLGSSFVLYNSFRADVKHVVGLYPANTLQDNSAGEASRASVDAVGNVAVVGVEKELVLHGFGLGAGDTAFWAVDGTSGEVCSVGNAAAGVGIMTVSVGGVVIPADAIVGPTPPVVRFTFSDANEGRRLVLCYRVSGEAYVGYPSVTLSVSTIVSIVPMGESPDTSGTSANVVVAGVAMNFVFTGHGVSAGDEVRWVYGAAAAGQECGDENTVPIARGGQATPTIQSLVIDNNSSVVVRFDAASTGLRMCFKHSTEGLT